MGHPVEVFKSCPQSVGNPCSPEGCDVKKGASCPILGRFPPPKSAIQEHFQIRARHDRAIPALFSNPSSKHPTSSDDFKTRSSHDRTPFDDFKTRSSQTLTCSKTFGDGSRHDRTLPEHFKTRSILT